MQIVVTGRRTTVEDSLRTHIADRLARLDKLDPKVTRVDVEVSEESNPRLSGQRVRVELTWHGKGPVVRGEAAGAEPREAADLALGKLDRRLRKAADRRRIHRGHHTPLSLAAMVPPPGDPEGTTNSAESATGTSADPDGHVVVREKDHVAAPMTLDQALFEMELVGHEFFLFIDADRGVPSVVYRRRGYDYGVLRLHAQPAPDLPVQEAQQAAAP
jgi:ribosomal subunit interface protein